MLSAISKSDMQPFITEYCSQAEWFMKQGVTLKQHILTGLRDVGFGDAILPDEILSTLDSGEEKLRQAIGRDNRDQAKQLAKQILN